MKRTVSLLCLILALLFLLTGCIRYEASIKVNSNGTADISLLTACADSLGEDDTDTGMSFSLSEEEIAEYKAKGYTYEPYRDEDAEYSGYILSRTGVPLKELTGSGEAEGEAAILESGFRVDGKRVTLDFRPFAESDYEESGEYLSMIKLNHGYMRIKLELPVKPTAHNATSVSSDGKTLTWDLTKFDGKEPVHAEFTLPGSSFLVWLLPLLVVIAAALFFFLRRKKAAQAGEVPAEVPSQPEEAPGEAAVEAQSEDPEND